ncbi:MAG: hypothetical protein ACTSSE_18320 [Candidatus Thorarchaeota archaeon]
MIDPDSDNDGLIDGNETSWNFDTDGDGDENMIDPDSDGDGLADGWMDGMIWSWVQNKFVDFDDYKNWFSGYSFPNERNNVYDPWEGEDTNCNGIHDQDEPDMTKVDTDGDSLWDGFDVYSEGASNDTRTTCKPLHFGELYYLCYSGSIEDNGMPYSGGDNYRWAQIIRNIDNGIQMTSQANADSDRDGLTDYEEILPWYILVEDFIPPYETNPWKTIKSYYAYNLVGTNEITSDPNNADSDGDGLTDKEEYLYTNPLDKDSDNDGLSDYTENPNKNRFKDISETNPLDRDTDNDGLPDGWADGWNGSNKATAVDKIKYGELVYDGPSNWNSFPADIEFGEYMNTSEGEFKWISNPLQKDSDYDHIPDGIEMCYYWNVKKDPFKDSDNDGTGDLFEMDSDHDGLTDSEENVNRDFYLNGWWAVYTNANTKPSNAIWVVTGESYRIFHYNETDPTVPDCDNDGLLDSVEPDPLMDTDGDGYINAWDQDSNDAEGNGPGVGPTAWEGPEGSQYTCEDSDDNTNNADLFDHVLSSNWSTGSDYNQTYVVFRTNCEDIDGDGIIDYADIENSSGKWISVDSVVNLFKEENPNCDLGSEYLLEHSWTNSAYLIHSVVKTRPSDTIIKVHYGSGNSSNPQDILTPEGYILIESGNNVYIEIDESHYVKCVDATGDVPSDFVTSDHSDTDFAANGQETIDGRPALNMDSDFDGIINPIEVAYGLNKDDADTDNDGILDGDEFGWWNNSDGDDQFYAGFTNSGGYISINALDPDSDNDGVLDGTEIGVTTVHSDSRTNVNPQSDKPHNYPVFIRDNCKSFDADKGHTVTDPLDPDTDDDGLADGFEDLDHDGILDAGERKGEDIINNDYFNGNFNYSDGKIEGDTNQNGYWSDSEKWKETSPIDSDSDDDGISDKNETYNNGTETSYWYDDHDEDGMINAVDPDSDNDGLYDGLERGYKPGDVSIGTDLTRGYFIPDSDQYIPDR